MAEDEPQPVKSEATIRKRIDPFRAPAADNSGARHTDKRFAPE